MPEFVKIAMTMYLQHKMMQLVATAPKQRGSNHQTDTYSAIIRNRNLPEADLPYTTIITCQPENVHLSFPLGAAIHDH